MAMDEKTLWEAVGWNGEIDTSHILSENKPSETQFQQHLESLLNPGIEDNENFHEANYTTTIPILDQPIIVEEVEKVIPRMKPKGSQDGLDGNHEKHKQRSEDKSHD